MAVFDCAWSCPPAKPRPGGTPGPSLDDDAPIGAPLSVILASCSLHPASRIGAQRLATITPLPAHGDPRADFPPDSLPGQGLTGGAVRAPNVYAAQKLSHCAPFSLRRSAAGNRPDVYQSHQPQPRLVQLEIRPTLRVRGLRDHHRRLVIRQLPGGTRTPSHPPAANPRTAPSPPAARRAAAARDRSPTKSPTGARPAVYRACSAWAAAGSRDWTSDFRKRL